jgi:tetratricopeptide (TPR) repeat protein
MELGNHEEANEELELIDAPLRAHPDVLEVRWGIYAKVKNWEACLHIGTALIKLAPERTTGWIGRSFALHETKRTQEAYDELKPALDVFKNEQLVWYNMACYACVLGNKDEARELLDKAIELGGDAVKAQALDDPDLQGVWGSEGGE